MCPAGPHKKVDRDTLVDCAKFAKYAIASYGANGYQFLHGHR